MPPCLTLSIVRYGSRVKWSNPGTGLAPSPTPWCSSYRKGSLRVTLDYGRQLYYYTLTHSHSLVSPPLSLSLYFHSTFFSFLRIVAGVVEKTEELNSGQKCVLTDWRSSFLKRGVWNGKQPLATSYLFEGWILIGQGANVIRGNGKVESAKRENQTSQLVKRSPNRQTCL